MCMKFFLQQVSLTGLCSDYRTKLSVYVHYTDIVHICDPAHSLHAAFFSSIFGLAPLWLHGRIFKDPASFQVSKILFKVSVNS